MVGGGIAIFLLFIILLSRTAGDTNLANTSQENTTDYPRESDFNPDLFIPSPDTPTSQDQIPPHINTPPSTSEELIEAIEARRPINCQAPIAGGSIRSRIQANDGHSRARITTNYIQGIGLILGNVDILVTPDRLYLWGNGGAWHWAHDGDVSIWELVDVVASSDDGRVVCDLVNPNNFNPPRHINFVESWLTLDEFLQR
ncbi:hypothetical protein FWD07_00255 [Candidatus Saccharibacteria bacterium]|nr:hypothetical protein [Candidatus Saccharibacteria bacterium]